MSPVARPDASLQGHIPPREPVPAVRPLVQPAHVPIEAAYRMKLIGIGLEPPPVKMVTYLSELQSPRTGLLERWWFTPHYDGLKVSDDRLAMEHRSLEADQVQPDKDGSLKARHRSIEAKHSEGKWWD